jgi:two-component system, NarL family, sensor histidine kinase UhpB
VSVAASIPDIGVEITRDSTQDRHRGGAAARRAMPRYLPLFWRVLVTNTVVVGVACAVTVAVLSPGRFSSVAAEEALVLAGAAGAIYAANLFLLRRAFAPLEQLTRVAREIDPMRPGQRVPVDEQHSEAGELAAAVNEMLARLGGAARERSPRAGRPGGGAPARGAGAP